MKNKKNIIILGVLLLLAMVLVVFIYIKRQSKVSEDALKFKEEYEVLNGTSRKENGPKYGSLNISSDNPINYVNIAEAIEILESDKAIIYVGAAWCPWCRNAVPVLFEVAEEFDVDTIYYLNFDNEKSTFEIKDGMLVQTRKGTDDYYKLLDKLSDNLRNYVLTDDNGKEYDTGEKRIYMPFVIGIKDGNVVDTHTGTVDLDEGQSAYDSLTEKQHDELFNVYENMFEEVYGSNTCNEKTCE